VRGRTFDVDGVVFGFEEEFAGAAGGKVRRAFSGVDWGGWVAEDGFLDFVDLPYVGKRRSINV
jgi:hypothetical protein